MLYVHAHMYTLMLAPQPFSSGSGMIISAPSTTTKCTFPHNVHHECSIPIASYLTADEGASWRSFKKTDYNNCSQTYRFCQRKPQASYDSWDKYSLDNNTDGLTHRQISVEFRCMVHCLCFYIGLGNNERDGTRSLKQIEKVSVSAENKC